MSLYTTQRVIFDLKRDKQQASLFKTNPHLALQDADLNDEERAALADGDLVALFRMGVHPLLLRPFSRMVGISPEKYQQVLAPFKGTRSFSSEYRLDRQEGS